MRWEGFVDPESKVVRCELRVIDVTDLADKKDEVLHEANVPCDGTEQQTEMTGLNLQHRHAR